MDDSSEDNLSSELSTLTRRVGTPSKEHAGITASSSSKENIEQPSTPSKEHSFRPLNFPVSPEFTPPPRVRTPLPGIVPERAAPFETQQQQECEEDEDHYEEDESPGFTWLHILVVFAAIALSMIGAVYTMTNYHASDYPFKSNITKSTFKIDSYVNKKLFGQPEAVEKVLENLRNMVEVPESASWCRVLLLTGGPGVGKDYLAQIVKNKFYSVGGQECKKHSYLSFSSKKLNCKRKDFNLLSFETIYAMDKLEITKAATTISSLVNDCEKNKDRTVFMIPVLTIKAHSIPSLDVKGIDSFFSSSEYWKHTQSEGQKAKQMFDDSGIPSEIVFFRPLSWAHVKLCIIESAERLEKDPLSQDTMDDILNSLLSTSGTVQDFVPVGCKDVDSLVALLPPKV